MPTEIKMRVLVTRPEPEASQFAGELKGMGFEPVICPLTKFERIVFNIDDIEEVAAWILTSPRASYALSSLPKVPVFAVGEATARAALNAGAEKVQHGKGGWRELTRLILDANLREQNRLVHLCGEEVRGDMGPALKSGGLVYKRVSVYRMVECQEAMSVLKQSLTQHSIDIVTLFSPRSARLFFKIVQQAKISLFDQTILCLSPAIGECVASLDGVKVEICDRPERKALFHHLDGLKRRC